MNEFYIDTLEEAKDDAYLALEKKAGNYFSDVLSDKVVDVLAVANIAVTFTVDNETKQMLTQAFKNSLNADEINKILTTDKQTLNSMLNAAKQLNEFVKEDELNEKLSLSEEELSDAAYAKQQISELKSYIEEQTQQITKTESTLTQKQHTKERKHDTIDF